MRLIGTIYDIEKGLTFSGFLNKHGIKNQAEIVKNEDWGNEKYGTYECHIWVYDEEKINQAEFYLDQFWQDPDLILKDSSPPTPKERVDTMPEPETNVAPTIQKTKGILSLCLIGICIGVFVWSQMTIPKHPDEITLELAVVPLTSAPIKKTLMFDWPVPFQIVDKITRLYGPDVWENPNDLPPEGKFLLNKALNTPVWVGAYPLIIDLAKGRDGSPFKDGELFAKIREGEIWRAWTPCLLHFDLFHLFFNLIWLAFLGRQIEEKLGIGKYIFFLLFAGVFSNTCQYLMTGPNFLGYSGILCAYFGFIWVRQRKAPWEGYQLQPALLTFIAVFVFGMAFLQLTSFFTEVYLDTAISPGIANTAHLSGGLAGIILGYLPIFSRKR